MTADDGCARHPLEGNSVDADDAAAAQRRSTVRVVPATQPRKLTKVPFVEMADGRLQGVVSLSLIHI